MARARLDVFSGLEIMRRETALLEQRVRLVCESSAMNAYGSPNTPGLSVYAYGSPGRREMVGGDGDADVFILEERRTAEGRKFRKLFVEGMERFDYSKLDLPEWGVLSETELFLARSLVEGNQVLETRFLWGDKATDSELNKLKSKYNTLRRAVTNFVFNRLYLDEYFDKKTRKGALNVKYCRGGSRELLFLSWYEDILRLFAVRENRPSQKPRCFEGAEVALGRGIIDQTEYEKFTGAVDYFSLFRTDILGANRNTPDRGLSFLDAETLVRLRTRGYPMEKEILEEFERNRAVVRSLVDKVYKDVISVGAFSNGSIWGENMRALQDPDLPERRLIDITGDSIITMVQLWAANNRGLRDCFLSLVRRHRATKDWAVIGTIVNSGFCPPDVLDEYGRGIGKEKGYGYLLRVIARNPNTPRDTLKSISEDPSLEKRYTAIAKAALADGVEGTKNQL